MAAVRYTEPAEEDLLAAWLSIAADNAAAADRVIDTLRDAAAALAHQPLMGRQRQELGMGLHIFPTRSPYILFYRPENDGITVVRILHHARDVDEIDF